MKVFYCPVNSWDCPYWKENGTCAMVDEGLDPTLECDDTTFIWGDEAGRGTYYSELEEE